nr:MAG TPA: HNH endonuclease [Caudoviricetes sp.]
MEYQRETKQTCSNACRHAIIRIRKGTGRLPIRAIPEGCKWCPKCSQALPLSEFYQGKNGRYFSYCRPCKRRADHEWKRRKRGLPLDAVLKPGTEAAIGSMRTDTKGYVLRKVGVDRNAHPRADKNGWVYDHVLVMEESLGFPITREYTIHHRNGDRGDNRLNNLELRHGPHGKGADAIPYLLSDKQGEREAIRVLEAHGYTVIPPTRNEG